ncbi:MAG TPA: hypothetical protein VID74_01915 [Gemmatimonadales bacterium]
MKLPRNAQLWLPGWYAARRRHRAHRFDPANPVTVHLMFADHFEPYWGRPTDAVARARVAAWSARWPEIAERQRDDEGRPARWTFFYPEEEYRPEVLDALAAMTRRGVADVEIHIHHDGEGEADFMRRMRTFIRALSRDHGLLHEQDGRIVFGFIHGNWALDNSRPDGRWCGLNNELTLLRQLGCYADFTMPAAPDVCQTRLVNAIYWAVDDPARAKSHDTGSLATRDGAPPRDALLCVQGPLTLRRHPRWRVIPSLEVGELAAYAAPSRARAKHWLDAAPRIGNDLFVKLYTHGAPEKNSGPLLEGFIDGAVNHVRAECRRRGHRLRFATAWEFCQAIAAGPFAAQRPVRPRVGPGD